MADTMPPERRNAPLKGTDIIYVFFHGGNENSAVFPHKIYDVTITLRNSWATIAITGPLTMTADGCTTLALATLPRYAQMLLV